MIHSLVASTLVCHHVEQGNIVIVVVIEASVGTTIDSSNVFWRHLRQPSLFVRLVNLATKHHNANVENVEDEEDCRLCLGDVALEHDEEQVDGRREITNAVTNKRSSREREGRHLWERRGKVSTQVKIKGPHM
jgi:hypothetical protein